MHTCSSNVRRFYSAQRLDLFARCVWTKQSLIRFSNALKINALPFIHSFNPRKSEVEALAKRSILCNDRKSRFCFSIKFEFRELTYLTGDRTCCCEVESLIKFLNEFRNVEETERQQNTKYTQPSCCMVIDCSILISHQNSWLTAYVESWGQWFHLLFSV